MPRKPKELIVHRLRNRMNGEALEYYFISARCKPHPQDSMYVLMLETVQGIGTKDYALYVDNSTFSHDPEKLKESMLRRLTTDSNNHLASLGYCRKQYTQLKALQPEGKHDKKGDKKDATANETATTA